MPNCAFDRGDGVVGITNPSPRLIAKLLATTPMTEAEAVQSIMFKTFAHLAMPTDTTYLEVPAKNDDRDFREAWVVNAGAIEVDLARARPVHLARLRERRNRALEQLDGRELKAMSEADATELAAVRLRKQRLRDLPTRVAAALAAAKTPAELRAVTAPELED